MPRSMKVMLAACAVLAALGALLMWLATPAQANEWYTGRTDPVTGNGCCGGNDCAPVPLDADWVQPVADGFQVIMTAEQAHDVNPNATLPINVMVPWERVMLLSAGADAPPALYHVCIWDSKLKCLFVVPST